jgi:hypothetical protein
MSPFQSAGEFIDYIGQVFKSVVEVKLKLVVQRNTIVQKDHAFVVQSAGDKMHLVFLPSFYDTNRRSQLILTANTVEVVGSTPTMGPTYPAPLLFVKDTTLEQILSQPTISGTIVDGDQTTTVNLSNITIVKNHSLRSKYRDPSYPELLPFYLYGTPDAAFIDHVLTRSTNVQITTAQKVSLELNNPLTAEQLQTGVLAFLAEPERPRQPPFKTSQNVFPSGKREFNIEIYADPHAPTANGPGLTDLGGAQPIASGKVTLAAWPWVWLGLNVGQDPPQTLDPDVLLSTIEELLVVSPPIMESVPTTGKRSAAKHTAPKRVLTEKENLWAEQVAHILPTFRTM